MKKVTETTKLGFVFICPHCGSERFSAREGFHLLARWECLKCEGTFREPKREQVRKKKTYVSQTSGSGKRKPKKFRGK